VTTSDLQATRTSPGRLVIRLDASLAGAVAPDDLQMSYVEGGPEVTVNPCLASGVIPAGATACVVRAGSGAITNLAADGNYYVYVNTTTTSRWIIRRESEDVTPPTLFTPASQKKGQLGRTVKVVSACSEACQFKVTGFIKVGNVKLPLRKGKGSAPALVSKVLKLRLSQGALQHLSRLHAKHGKAKIDLVAMDASGNKVEQQVTVTLR